MCEQRHNLIYIYMYLYLGKWDVSLDPIKQTVLTEAHIMQSTTFHNCSGEGGGEVVHPQ